MSDTEQDLFDVSEFGSEEDDVTPIGQGSQYLGEYTGLVTIIGAQKSDRACKDPAFDNWDVIFQAPSQETIKKTFAVPIAKTFMYRKTPDDKGNLFMVRVLKSLLEAAGFPFSVAAPNVVTSFATLKKVFVNKSPLVGKQVKIEVKFPSDRCKIEKNGLQFVLVDAHGKPVVVASAFRTDPQDLSKTITETNIIFNGISKDAVKAKLGQFGFNPSDIIGFHEVKSISAPDVVVKSAGALDAHSSVNDLL